MLFAYVIDKLNQDKLKEIIARGLGGKQVIDVDNIYANFKEMDKEH